MWVAEKVGWRLEKKNRIMHFFIKNSFSSLYLKVSSSELLERWATMWPHSEHLVTIWNTPAVNWRRRRQERRSLVLFMIPGLVAIWVPPSCRLQGMAPICERGLSAALPTPLHLFAPHSEVLKKRSGPVFLFHGFEGHFISPQVSVSVTNSSESGELISQELASRQQHIDVTVGGIQWEECHTLDGIWQKQLRLIQWAGWYETMDVTSLTGDKSKVGKARKIQSSQTALAAYILEDVWQKGCK